MRPSHACPACGGTAQEAPVVAREMMFGRDECFAYLVCAGCGTLRLADVPGDMGQYYPADYYSIDIDPEAALGRPGVRQFATSVSRSILFGRRTVASAAQRVVRMRQFHSFVNVVDQVAFAGLPAGRGSAVLDVGCGSGIIVYALGLAGIRTSVGVDPFAPGDRRFDTGARLQRSDLEEVEGTFDLVMFHHSLEHVPDPGASLAAAAERLAPGGRILVRMPTVSSDAYREYGADWVQLDAPRHISLFSRAGVDALAARHGLRVAAVRDDSTSFQFWGSEQVRRGIPLMAPTSHLISERDSVFSGEQIAGWEGRAGRLNAAGRGDQAAWVLVKDSA
jgi:SAM-dependent methyltransferase